MKWKKKGKVKLRALSLFLAAALVVTGIELPFSAVTVRAAGTEGGESAGDTGEVVSDKVGELDWSFEPGTGVLTISGSGNMPDLTNTQWGSPIPDQPWKNYKEQIKCVVIEEGVTSIGGFAFENHDALTSVKIAASVKRIGEQAFTSCEKLKKVELPDRITRLEDSIFDHCNQLEEVNIPENVTAIGNYVFRCCYKLQDITIPAGVKSIGDEAFADCSGLTNVKIMCEMPPTLGKDVFTRIYSSDSYSTKVVNVPEGKISEYMNADGWTEWKRFIIGDTEWNYDADNKVLTISGTGNMDDYPMSNESKVVPWKEYLSEIESVVIEDGVTDIGACAFKDCTALETIEIKNLNLYAIGIRAFSGCAALTGIVIPDGVTAIGKYAFSDCAALTEINMPDDVTVIKEYTFSGCAALTKMNIPDNVTIIEEHAFSGCAALTEINIPDGVRGIAEAVFENCSSLGQVEIPEGVTIIEKSAFQESGLTSVTIPGNVTTIKQYAFRNTAQLDTVIVKGESTALEVQEGMFTGCKFVTENKKGIIVPQGSETYYLSKWSTWKDYIKEKDTVHEGSYNDITWKFNATTGLLTVSGSGEIPGDSIQIYQYKLWHEYKDQIKEVLIQEGVTGIGDAVFYRYPNLEKVTIQEGMTSIGIKVFEGCESLSEVSIPDSVISIGNLAFYTCSSLRDITLPKNITEIAGSAFGGCPLTGIEIPEGVTVIGERAFTGCKSLSDVKLPEGLKKIEARVFDKCSNLKEIEIPAGVELNEYALSNYIEKVTVKGANPVTIDKQAFSECMFVREKMKEIVVPQGTKEIFQETWSSYSDYIREEGELPFEGLGTEDDPYQIGSKGNLLDLRILVNGGDDITGKHFQVTSKSAIELGSASWTPIGTAEHPFTGTFDGANHTVDGPTIDAPEKDNQGLFGFNAGMIENMTLFSEWENGNVNGKDNIGAIAGTNLESGTIKNCVSWANVTGENYVGSIVGRNYGTVIGCTNQKNVTGTGDSVGGIAGYNGENGTVKGCTNSGNVTVAEDSDNEPGAIIGNNLNTDPDAVTDDYYRQTEDINHGITGIGTGTGSESDPSGITSGKTPAKSPCSFDESTNTLTISDMSNTREQPWREYIDLAQVIVIEEGVTSIGSGAFLGFSKLTSIEIPNSVTNIGGFAFSGCEKLKSVTIPDGVTEIANNTFYNCKALESVTIPNSVTNIRSSAFSGCISLKSVRLNAVNPPAIDQSAFVDCKFYKERARGILIPEGTLSEYLQNENWRYYKDYMDESGNKSFTGMGTEDVPYEITNQDDLVKLRELVNNGESFEGKYFLQKGDIYAGSENEPWIPIGTEESPFKGIYDVSNNGGLSAAFKISGLYTDPKKPNQGLFGFNEGTIKNVSIDGGTITGTDNVGSVAGTNKAGGTIISCNTTNYSKIEGRNNVGGIVGNNEGSLTNCNGCCSVTGKENVGGVVGMNGEGGSLTKCNYVFHDELIGTSCVVTGTTGVGGVVGKSSGSVENCKNETFFGGKAKGLLVTGTRGVGGIVGINGVKGSIASCKNQSYVTGITGVGGIVGINEGSVTDCTNTGDVTGTEDVGGVVGTSGADGTEDGCENSGNININTTVENPFKGSGTEDDPYQIGSKEDLEKLRDLVNGGEGYDGIHFKVTADIDLGGSAENPWTPIGTEEHPFQGTFDGGNRDNKKVSGLYINDETKDNQGLFGVNEGTIKNLTVQGEVTGKDNTAGIVGTNTNKGIIEHCTNQAGVTGQDNVGGIAGKNEGTIKDCTNTGNIHGNDNVGGITGTNTGTVNGSENSGSVTGNGTGAGGIAGKNDGTLKNDTNTAPVTGRNDIGGIAGTNGENGTVEGCTNSGNVTASTASEDGTGIPGAIIGNNENTVSDAVKDDYYQQTDTINNGITGIGKGTGSGTDPAGITSGQTPKPSGSTDPTNPTDPTDPAKPFSGSGTLGEPYQISSKADLEKLRDLVNGGEDYDGIHFKVTADIDLGGSAENPWTPIGTEDHPFQGTFDGDNRKVSGLYINDAANDNQGLFGVNDGTIKNLTVQGEVTGKNNTGGIVGTNTNKGIIENCTNQAGVTGQDNVGGIAGRNEGIIKDCTNTGNIHGNDNVGGITGTNTGAVNGSENSGAVSGNDNVGGITGTNTGTVNDSENSGSVTGNGTGAGGIAGKNDGILNKDTNTAPVTGRDDIGGITGTNGENGTVEGCTNSGNVTASEDGTGIPGAIIGNNQNADPNAVKDDYYQKTDTINNGITGIGEGTGENEDPEGITSGPTPTDPVKDKEAAKSFEEKTAAIEKASPIGGDAWIQAVKDAKDTFDNLTEVQKNLVSETAKNTLADAEAILAAVEKITSIGAVANTAECARKIKDAKDAYEKLTNEQKSKLPEDIKKILTNAEAAYAALTTAVKGPEQEILTPEQKEEKEQIQAIAKELGVSEATAAKIQALAKELGIPVEALLLSDDAFAGQSSEDDMKGSTFSLLQAKASKVTKNSVKLTWKKVKGADGYQIYSTRCGKGNKVKLVQTIQKNSKTSYTQKKLEKGRAYRYIVRAYKVIDGKKITLAASKSIHIFTSGGKYGNAKSVKLKNVKKSKISMTTGKTFKIKAAEVKEKKPLKRHRALSYESSDTKVATVTKKGKIKAVAKGKCFIYVYAQNGQCKKIKVTVK